MSEFNHPSAKPGKMMKTLDLKSVLIGVLLTMLIAAFMIIAIGGGTPGAWEYQHLSAPGRGDTAGLNKLGDEGWELVGYSFAKHPTGQGNDWSYYVLKRPKKSHWNWKFWK